MNVLRPTLLTLACLLTQPTMASDLPSLGDASSALVSPQQEYQLGRAWLSIVRGQVSRSAGPTTSRADTFFPSPCNVQGSGM